jgi:hypothetical protein
MRPSCPYVTDALFEILHDDGTVHARGAWPKAGDQAEKGVFATEGENFVQILAAARKVKSEAQVSMRTEASMLTVAGEGELESLIGDTVGDLLAVTNAGRQGGRRCRGAHPGDLSRRALHGRAGAGSSGRIAPRSRGCFNFICAFGAEPRHFPRN